jgi:hypothetical protein
MVGVFLAKSEKFSLFGQPRGENLARLQRATQNNSFELILSVFIDSTITKARQNPFGFPRLRRGNFSSPAQILTFGQNLGG